MNGIVPFQIVLRITDTRVHAHPLPFSAHGRALPRQTPTFARHLKMTTGCELGPTRTGLGSMKVTAHVRHPISLARETSPFCRICINLSIIAQTNCLKSVTRRNTFGHRPCLKTATLMGFLVKTVPTRLHHNILYRIATKTFCALKMRQRLHHRAQF